MMDAYSMRPMVEEYRSHLQVIIHVNIFALKKQKAMNKGLLFFFNTFLKNKINIDCYKT